MSQPPRDRWTRAILAFGDSFEMCLDAYGDEIAEDTREHPLGGRLSAIVIAPPILITSIALAIYDGAVEFCRSHDADRD